MKLHTLECTNRIGFPVVLRTDVWTDGRKRVMRVIFNEDANITKVA